MPTSREEAISRLPIPGPGRRPIFSDPEEMLAKGLEYFEERKANFKVFTISGLALHLGLSGHEALAEYQRRPAFTAIVKSLKARIVNQGEEGLYDKDRVNGSKFHLSVLGMKDVQVVETKNTNLNADVSALALENLSDDDLARLVELRQKLANPGTDRSGTGTEEAPQDLLSLPGPGASAP